MPKKIVTKVTVEHKRDGCPIDQRHDEHKHTQRDWKAALDRGGNPVTGRGGR